MSTIQRLTRFLLLAVALVGFTSSAQAEEQKKFTMAWSIYVGWMPWAYIDQTGIMDKWADKYGIEVELRQVND